MRREEAARLVALLVAHYPASRFETEDALPYVFALARFEWSEAEQAVAEIALLDQRLPSVARVVDVIVRRRIAAPSRSAAWGELVTLQRWRRSPDGPRPALHPLAKRALDLMGGLVAYERSDRPGIWRAQFERTYEDVVNDAVRLEGLSAGGVPASYEPINRPLLSPEPPALD